MIHPLYFLGLIQVVLCDGILLTSLGVLRHWILAHLLLSYMFFEKLHLLLILWPIGLVLIRPVNDFLIFVIFQPVYQAFFIWILLEFHTFGINYLDLNWFYWFTKLFAFLGRFWFISPLLCSFID